MPDASASIIIVGGGASGVLLAAQLLRHPDPDLHVTLIEQHGAVGQGLAYSARNRDHRVNVPARGMSAFADDPDHFWRWLQSHDPGRYDSAWVFVPRLVYGLYLEDVLREAAAARPERLDIVSGAAVQLVETASGVEVTLADGRILRGHMAALAVGHETQQARGRGIAVRVGSPEDTPLDFQAEVMILGSGLSMVDAWVSLAEAEHGGPIKVVSRNGLLPTAHMDVAPITIAGDVVPFGASLVVLLGWFRGLIRRVEAEGGDWRSVLDGLRPHNQTLWQSWTEAQKRQFLRHLRPWWNIHRHRLPPDLHERLVAAIARGQVELIAAEFLAIEAAGDNVLATIRPRGTARREVISVARVYDCGGVSVDVRASGNPVVRHLVESGAARPDRMNIGLDVDETCALVNGDGQASRRVHVVGPLTRGRYFEIEAIPDIRVQCANVARQMLAER